MYLLTKIYMWFLRILSVMLLGVIITHASAAGIAATKTDLAMAGYMQAVVNDRLALSATAKQPAKTPDYSDARAERIANTIAGAAFCVIGIWGWCQDSNYGLITGTYFFARGGICLYKAKFN